MNRLPIPNLTNAYLTLPKNFYAKQAPQIFPSARVAIWNHGLASELGISDSAPFLDIIHNAANSAREHAVALPYAGHQFGHFSILGDGRAHFLGEIAGYEAQLKGSGRTVFSRGGDGRASLGPMLREYLVSEGMNGLGIPTTRSLAVFLTGDKIMRQSVEQGAILLRLAKSHLRVGSFQYFAAQGQFDHVRTLADFAIEKLYPDIANGSQKYLHFLENVIARQAWLISEWQRVGFVHGVMNTDNMSISGETIDYGPCAFLDNYQPEQCFSAIDQNKRYAFANQGVIAVWNLTRLAESLIELLPSEDAAIAALEGFNSLYAKNWLNMMRRKLGIKGESAEDAELIGEFLGYLQAQGADYSLSFQKLAWGELEIDAHWLNAWQKRISHKSAAHEIMAHANPIYIPRNHQIAKAIRLAEVGDWSYAQRLFAILSTPYERQDGAEEFEKPPQETERVLRTYCGT